MMLILKHGNKKSYSMLETSISVFIFSLLLLVILEFAITYTKSTNKIKNKVEAIINIENERVYNLIENR